MQNSNFEYHVLMSIVLDDGAKIKTYYAARVRRVKESKIKVD